MNLERNQALIADLALLAGERESTPAQIAIAWALTKAKTSIPPSSPERAAASRFAQRSSRSPLHRGHSRIEQIGEQIAGTRYDPAQMQMLDSEESQEPEPTT